MEKIGYTILISMYLIAFPLAEELSDKFGYVLNNIFYIDNRSINTNLASRISKAIGMEDFIKSINDGL